jgi:hypothetical protein
MSYHVWRGSSSRSKIAYPPPHTITITTTTTTTTTTTFDTSSNNQSNEASRRSTAGLCGWNDADCLVII